MSEKRNNVFDYLIFIVVIILTILAAFFLVAIELIEGSEPDDEEWH